MKMQQDKGTLKLPKSRLGEFFAVVNILIFLVVVFMIVI